MIRHLFTCAYGSKQITNPPLKWCFQCLQYIPPDQEEEECSGPVEPACHACEAA